VGIQSKIAHIMAARKQREIAWVDDFPPFPLWMVLPAFRVDLPLLVNPVCEFPHRHTQRCAFSDLLGNSESN
jgi:hypothetical protein